MLKLNSWKSDLKTRCFMMFLFSIVFVCLRYIQSKHIQAIQYTSIHINTHQYTSLLTQKRYKTFDVFHDFLGLRCGLCGPSGALPGRPRAPRRQRHRHGGPQWPPRRGAPHPADGARRRGQEGRRRVDRAARGGDQRPRGDLPGAAGGGRGGRQERRRPLGPEEMDARCFGEISRCQTKSKSKCEM